MTYAGERRIVDADSHLMEWPGFLTDHADPAFRDGMPPIGGAASGFTPESGRHSEEELTALRSLGGDLVRKGPKWYGALGAVDGAERSMALDQLGFDAQVVFSSLCAPLFDVADDELRYEAYRAHNRAVASFNAAAWLDA